MLPDVALPTTLIALGRAIFVQAFHVISVYELLLNHEKMYYTPALIRLLLSLCIFFLFFFFWYEEKIHEWHFFSICFYFLNALFDLCFTHFGSK